MVSPNQPLPEKKNPQAEPKTEEQEEKSLPKRASGKGAQGRKFLDRFIVLGSWTLAVGMVLFTVYLALQSRLPSAVAADKVEATFVPTTAPVVSNPDVAMPPYIKGGENPGIERKPDLKTIIPNRPREEVIEYTVQQGDSVFAIAQNFNLKPETILWANFNQLQDSPDSLSVGMVLNVPPVDGVYYEWAEGDTLQGVANAFEANYTDVINFPGNNLDLTDPKIEPGQYVMLPGGHREFRSWIVPQIARGKAGVSKSVYGPGACEGSYEGLYGGGGFIWPAANHFLSGNDFWSGHLGIDIAGGQGDNVLASDSGVVVFAGWATGGYGYMIMVDHGNGYQTLYAHLSSVSVGCGQSVYQGNYIGAIGSTGNSTGSHLHFEVRLYGQFVNPWHVLP